MKTTLAIDDEVYRRVKAKAALEGRKVTEVVEEALRSLLDGGMLAPRSGSNEARRLELPLVGKTSDGATLFEGMSQEEIHRRLAELQSDVDTPSV
jgi:hypothetical protein